MKRQRAKAAPRPSRAGASGTKARTRAGAAARQATKGRPIRPHRVDLLLGTIKGAFVLRGDGTRSSWRIDGPHLLGSQVSHFVVDPRDGGALLMAARTGHLGPTIFRSTDRGATWVEARRPPAFPARPDQAEGPAVESTFFLAPGHRSQPGVWWAGTVPHALFRSEDGGTSWTFVDGFGRFLAGLEASKPTHIGATPGGAITHSIIIDPRDAGHMYVSLSVGGFFETTDGAQGWRPVNEGVSADFYPDKFPEFGQDPHCAVMSPVDPDRLYQQNHCGVYRLDRPGVRWERIGTNLPADVGDIGFPIAAHPRDRDTLWVFPMDGTSVWPRTSPGGRPAAYCSRNGGRTWTRQAKGFPAEQGWLTVFRQAMKCDTRDPVGVYIGTTSGEVWASRDEGATWRLVASHLPRILSLEVVEP